MYTYLHVNPTTLQLPNLRFLEAQIKTIPVSNRFCAKYSSQQFYIHSVKCLVQKCANQSSHRSRWLGYHCYLLSEQFSPQPDRNDCQAYAVFFTRQKTFKLWDIDHNYFRINNSSADSAAIGLSLFHLMHYLLQLALLGKYVNSFCLKLCVKSPGKFCILWTAFSVWWK